MPFNDSYFVPPEKRNTLLQVRGFKLSGAKSGGIVDPVEVDIPPNAVLLRFYHDNEYGAWWMTAAEAAVIIAYFGRIGVAFGEGRKEGKGILHGALAVRHDWSHGTLGASAKDKPSPLQLGKFLIVRVMDKLRAFHGEGDEAPDASYRNVLKGYKVIDESGRQRGVRQVFLPNAWNYKHLLPRIGGGQSDADLAKAVAAVNSLPLPFER